MIQYGACNLSVIPLRAEASDKSEILSQLIFGDEFEIIDLKDNWAFIRTCFDDYEGWIDPKQLTLIKGPYQGEAGVSILGLKAFHEVVKLSTNETLRLPAGAVLPTIDREIFTLGNEQYKIEDCLVIDTTETFEQAITASAKFFLHSPYLWGGKTVFGIDCSGFTQIVFRMLGKKLKRDAWQQAEQGETVNFLQEARAGDLAFFDNEEGRVTHVGIMLDDQHIIHASGRVKIDPIDGQGIYSLDLKKHTHKLRIIKRY